MANGLALALNGELMVWHSRGHPHFFLVQDCSEARALLDAHVGRWWHLGHHWMVRTDVEKRNAARATPSRVRALDRRPRGEFENLWTPWGATHLLIFSHLEYNNRTVSRAPRQACLPGMLARSAYSTEEDPLTL